MTLFKFSKANLKKSAKILWTQGMSLSKFF